MKCPICGCAGAHKHYGNEFGTEEEYFDCAPCGYHYEFAYGNYVEAISGLIEISWSYSYSDELKAAYSAAMRLTVEMHKNNRQKEATR